MGARTAHAPEQGHNHNLDCVALNYLCPVSRLRVTSHNITKCRRMGPVSRITFCLSCLCMFTTHLLDPGWGPDPPAGARVPAVDVFYVDGGCSRIFSSDTSQGAHRRRFLSLMMGAPGSSASAPPWGLAIDNFYVDGERSWISVSTSQGPTVDVS
jgi:hypothetical protein